MAGTHQIDEHRDTERGTGAKRHPIERMPARAAAPALDAVVAFLRGDAVDVKGHGGAPLPANLDPGAALAGDARVSFVARLEKFTAGVGETEQQEVRETRPI